MNIKLHMNPMFFFQAEDGIRDRDVTGVQTCALPIRSEEHTSELQSHHDLVCRLLLVEVCHGESWTGGGGTARRPQRVADGGQEGSARPRPGSAAPLCPCTRALPPR